MDISGTLNIDGDLILIGGGVVDMRPSGSVLVLSRGPMALDTSSSLDLGSFKCTGIKIGEQTTIGAIYMTYLGQAGIIYGSNLPTGSDDMYAHYFYSQQHLTGSEYMLGVINYSDEVFTISNKGDVEMRRPIHEFGTDLTSASFALSPGWGVGAKITEVRGNDTRFAFTVTAGSTGRAANPSVVFTFKDGAYENSPFAFIQLVSSSSPADLDDAIGVDVSSNKVVVTYAQTPGVSSVYKFVGHVIG